MTLVMSNYSRNFKLQSPCQNQGRVESSLRRYTKTGNTSENFTKLLMDAVKKANIPLQRQRRITGLEISLSN